MRKFFSYETYRDWRALGNSADIPVKLVGENCEIWEKRYLEDIDLPAPKVEIPAPVHDERIVAAAIEIEGLCISLPQPARHGHVHMVCWALGIPQERYMPATQGFMTSTGRFVNRVMAKHIAHRAGQPQLRPEKERSQAELFSEDLW